MKKILILLPLIFLCSCQSDTPADPPSIGMVAVYPVGTRTLNYTIEQGRQVKFRLVSNPTTGFDWEVTDVNEGCSVQKIFIAPRADRMTGVPGFTEIAARPDFVGTHHFQLLYRRSWEKDVPPAAVVTVKIRVLPRQK